MNRLARFHGHLTSTTTAATAGPATVFVATSPLAASIKPRRSKRERYGEVLPGGRPSPDTAALYRQREGEEGWTELTVGLPQDADGVYACRSVLIHPDDPNVVIAGTQDGPFVSRNGGDSFTRLGDFPSGLVTWCMAFEPGNPNTIYLGTAPEKVFKSVDGGEHWRELPIVPTAGMVTMGFPCRVIKIAIDPADTKTVYAGLEVGGIIKSSDGGDSWHDATNGLLELALTPEFEGNVQMNEMGNVKAEGMMDTHAIVTSAAHPGSIVLAGRLGLFSSHDYGERWESLGVSRWTHTSEMNAGRPLQYVRDVRVSPHNENVLFATCSDEAVGGDGSIYRSLDFGQSWERYDRGLIAPRTTMMQVSQSTASPDVVYAATRAREVFRTRDGGKSWDRTPLPPGMGHVYFIAS